MKNKWYKRMSIVMATCLSIGIIAPITSQRAFAEGETTTTETAPVEEILYQMKLDYVDSKDEAKVTYNASPSGSSTLPKDKKYQVVFDKNILPYGFPMNELNGRDIDFTATVTEPVNSDSPTVLTVKEWGLHSSNAKSKSYFVKFVETQFNKDGIATYYVETLDGSTIERMTFKEQELGSAFPRYDLVGSTFLVSGYMLTSDKKNVLVKDWVAIDETDNAASKEPEQMEGEIKTYYGEFQSAIAEDYGEGYYAFDVKFVDFDGKEYIARFDTRYIDRMPDLYGMSFKTTLQAEPKGLDGEHPVLQVKSFTVEEDNFEFKTDETVAVVGEMGQLVNEGHGRMTYEFVDGQKKYYAVFDENVVGSSFLSENLTGQTLELTGVVYKQNDTIYLGVMGYRDPYGADTGKPTSNGMYTHSFTGTVTYLLSYTEKEAMYKVVSKNGQEQIVVFSKDFLKDKLPQQSLIGKTYNFVTLFKGKTLNSSTKLLVTNYSVSSVEGFKQDRGKFIKIVDKSASAVIYEFESIEGGRFKVLVNTASVDRFGGEKALVGKVATIYGNERVYNDSRIFDAYLITPVNVEHLNKTKAETVTFRGFIQKVSQRDTKGLTFLATNQYGQSEYLYFETDFLESKFPAALSLGSVIKSEISVSGYRLPSGKIMVKDFNFPKVPTEYPDELKPKYEDPEYFPNMKGFTGILDVSDIGGTHLMLITASDKYILHGKPEVMKQIENNLRKIVYLRGEYREAGDPYWTGEIKVYDIKVVDSNSNVIIKPISEPIGDLIPDPQKEAHYTIQLPTERPKDYPYGEGIPEALFIPEIPMAKDIPNWK